MYTVNFSIVLLTKVIGNLVHFSCTNQDFLHLLQHFTPGKMLICFIRGFYRYYIIYSTNYVDVGVERRSGM